MITEIETRPYVANCAEAKLRTAIPLAMAHSETRKRPFMNPKLTNASATG